MPAQSIGFLTYVLRILSRRGAITTMQYPTTPDSRYFVVRGRLWRMSDPSLSPERRQALVGELMAARRLVGAARRSKDETALASARARVDAVKHQLGERGAVWWTDEAPDFNRRMVQSTPYATWYASPDLEQEAEG